MARGAHLDWGYVDQPPLTPLLTRGMSLIVGDSLVGPVSCRPCWPWPRCSSRPDRRELGGARAEQLLTAGATAISAMALISGHWLSTTTVDLLVWTLLCWLVIRAVRPVAATLALGRAGGGDRTAEQDPGAVPAGRPRGRTAPRRSAPGISRSLAVGRRGSRSADLGTELIWQATHGWPQLELSAAIAAGSSGSSQPWWLFLPFQLVLVSPGLVPIWVAGLVVLLRSADLRPYRFLAVAYLVLAVVFLLTVGKPYYITGLYPALLAAGVTADLAVGPDGAGRGGDRCCWGSPSWCRCPTSC